MYRIGVIGTGVMGTRMIHEIVSASDFEVGKIWDLNPAQAVAVSQQFDGLNIASSAAELVADDEIDLVYIATPPATHIEYANLVLDHGKPVYCEKPLAVDVAQSQKLVERAQASGLGNAINFGFATASTVQQMANAIKNGDAGEITRVAMRCHFQTWPRARQPAGDWLSGRADGGFVREVISHFIYMMEVVLGPVEVEWSNVSYPDDGAGSEIAIMAGLNIEGVPVQVTGGVGGAAPDVVECTFYGTKRSYRSLNWGTLMIGTGDGWDEEIVEDWSQRAQTLFGALTRLIDGKDHRLPEFSVGLKVQQVIETMLGG